jgi:hypothetical protein
MFTPDQIQGQKDSWIPIRIKELKFLTQKRDSKLSFVHPGSRIRILIFLPNPDPGPSGQKCTRSQIRNTGSYGSKSRTLLTTVTRSGKLPKNCCLNTSDTRLSRNLCAFISPAIRMQPSHCIFTLL